MSDKFVERAGRYQVFEIGNNLVYHDPRPETKEPNSQGLRICSCLMCLRGLPIPVSHENDCQCELCQHSVVLPFFQGTVVRGMGEHVKWHCNQCRRMDHVV